MINAQSFKHLLCVVLIVGAFCWLQHDRVPSGPYVYDEADYMLAASMGFVANALDTPSRSISDFIAIGWSTLTRRGNPSAVSLSQIARSGTDVNFYRHTHGPLYFYWLSLAGNWSQSEYAMRASALAIPVLTALMIYLGCLFVLPPPQNTTAAILGSALFLWNPTTLSSTELSPFFPFAFCVLAALFLAAAFLNTGSTRFWFASLVSAAAAAATLEVAFTVMAALVLVAWLARRRYPFSRPLILRSVGVFIASILIFWPAALLKLAFLKAYLFMAYLAVARKSAWGDITLADTWITRFTSSPVEWLLIAVALLLFWRRRKLVVQAWPFLLFSLMMILVVLPVKTPFIRYALPFQPGLDVTAAILLAAATVSWRPVLRGSAICGALVLLFMVATHYAVSSPAVPDRRTPAILQDIRDRGLAGKSLLVPQTDLPGVHFYFPSARLTAINESIPLSQQLQTQQIDAVLRPGQYRFEMPGR